MNALAQAVQRTFKPPREVSAHGMEFIQHAEGAPGTGAAMLTAYQDSKGVWTIGWGHTAGVVKGMSITLAQAVQYLDQDLDEAENAVATLALVPLNDNQFDALVSLVFNIGVTAFRDSTLLRQLNAGRYDLVPGQMAQWNKITVVQDGKKVKKVLDGLTNRRTAEAALFVQALPASITNTAAANAADFSKVEGSATVIPLAPHGQAPIADLANEVPEPPANTVAKTAAGKSGIAALVAGSAGMVTEGFNQVQPLIMAWNHIQAGTAGLGSWAKVVGVLFVAGAVGFSGWSLYQQHRKVKGDQA